MKRNITFLFAFLFLPFILFASSDYWIETENFSNKGGWVVDQQFMDQMGSPYLMAHGMGVPVKNATHMAHFKQAGWYHVYARTYNWTSPWMEGKGAGGFKLLVAGKTLEKIAGVSGKQWMWEYLGKVQIEKQPTEIALCDLTGFNGRCDAIYFSTDQKTPPSDHKELDKFRRAKLNIPTTPTEQRQFDLVVAGGGIAGMCAAVAAARQGLHVALVNDRPVLGGNNSSEIRVHLGGRIELEPYKELGNLIKEFAPTKQGNAQPAENYRDDVKQKWIEAEKNITLFASNRVIHAKMQGKTIQSVVAKHIETGKEMALFAPLFADCTGDGTLGALAGADYRMGRESKADHGEERAQNRADEVTMGTSVQWYSKDHGQQRPFPLFEYGVPFNEKNKCSVTMGEWTWETGMNFDQIKDFEYIRDYGLMVIYSNWSYLKNRSVEKSKYANLQLDWVAYIGGKRESRRLLGDYILHANDITDYKIYPDATASTSWSIDLHDPDPENTKHFPGKEFISTAVHTNIYPYPVPYRCLYSRNVNNLFMAGRNISITHVTLGTIRVMRTTGMLGEVVGLAASVCKKRNCNPREIYHTHFNDLKKLMQIGAGVKGLNNNQMYNEGGRLWERTVK